MSSFEELRNEINKAYPGTLTTATDRRVPDRIPFGVFSLDFSLLGGLPRGKMTHLIGNKHAGKSLLSYRAVANHQRVYPDEAVVIVDIEGSFDPVWAEMNGVRLDSLEIADCDYGEQAVDITESLLRCKEVGLIVYDSLAFTSSNEELGKSASDNQRAGGSSKLYNSFVRKINQALVSERKEDHYPSLIMLNQWRYKIGVMFGDPRTFAGEKPIGHLASLDIEIKNHEKIAEKGDYKGIATHNEHSFTISKNKMNSGYRKGEFKLVRMAGHIRDLKPGKVDNSIMICSEAKKLGLIFGRKPNWQCTLPGAHEVYQTQEDILTHMDEDHEFQRSSYMYLIANEARSRGMPEEFVERVLSLDYA